MNPILDHTAVRGIVLASLFFLGLSLPIEANSPGFAQEVVVIVLKDGTELSGVLVRETEEEIAIRSAFGVTSIERSRVREIRRGENPWTKEFEERFSRAEKIGKASQFESLGNWSLKKGLEKEAKQAFQRALALDPESVIARRGLGQAKYEGRWVDAQRVSELESQGYTRVGDDLVLREGESPEPDSGSTSKPNPRELSESELLELSKEEKRRLELMAERREERAEFEERRLLEFKGVPWSQRHRVKSKNYQVECNSTLNVARAYSKIMEALYVALSKRFKQRHLRSGRMTVKVYKTQADFMQRTGMGENTGGFYQPRSEEVNAFHGTFGNTSTTYNVLAHEGTHQFQGRVLPNMGNMNNWIIEGFAVYFGDGSRIDYDKNKIITGIIPRDRLLHIQDKLRNKTHTPLAQLAGLPRNRFGGSQYADSWAILYYLLNGPEKKKGQKFISQYWLLGTEERIGQDEFDTLAEHYFGGVETLEEKYREFILDLEPEPAGSVDKDGVFVSYDYMFEVFRLNEDWVYRDSNLRRGELVALSHNGHEQDRIGVSLLNKADEQQSAEDYVEEVITPLLAKNSTGLKREKVDLNEFSAWKFDWLDPDPNEKKKEGDEGAEGKSGEEDSPEKEDDKEPEVPPGPRKKYRAYVVVGVTNAYLIKGEFLLEEFDAKVDSFEATAQSFQRIWRNRW